MSEPGVEREVHVMAGDRFSDFGTIPKIDGHLVKIADHQIGPAGPGGLVESRLVWVDQMTGFRRSFRSGNQRYSPPGPLLPGNWSKMAGSGACGKHRLAT